MRFLVCFLGRNLVREDGGILYEAKQVFAGRDLVVIAGNDDPLLQDPTIRSLLIASCVKPCEVRDFHAFEMADYVVVANGGTTSQLVPVLAKLFASQAPLEVYDLQRKSMTKLWPE